MLDFAYDVIVHNEMHPVLELFTKNAEGEDVAIQQLGNEQEEAVYIAEETQKILMTGGSLEDIAVLYRINAQSRVIEEAFLHYGIPYVLVGGTRFYERKEIKDTLSYIRFLINPEDEVSTERLVKIGKKRFTNILRLAEEMKGSDFPQTDELISIIFEKTGYLELYDDSDPTDASRLENIKELRSVALKFCDVYEFLEQVALVESEYSESEKMKKNKKGVFMMTLHQAKGLEFPYVFIVGVEEGLLPHSRAMFDRSELEEERRLFYVGATRAEKKLFITHTEQRFLFGKRAYCQASRFINGNNDEDIHIRTF